MGAANLKTGNPLPLVARCPYCQSAVGHCIGHLWRCPVCDLSGRIEAVSARDLLDHYRQGFFKNDAFAQNSRDRKALYSQLLDHLAFFCPVGTLLDVGAGCGVFADAARSRGWKVAAIEPCVQAAIEAQKKFNLDVAVGTIADSPLIGPFDAVTFINVIDHTAAPWDDVKAARNLLKPEGLLFMRFPNGWLHAHLLKMACRLNVSGWVKPFLVFHAYSLTPAFIRRLLSDQGFVNIRIANSPLTGGDPYGSFRSPWLALLIKGVADTIAASLWWISSGRLCCGPSLIVTAFTPK